MKEEGTGASPRQSDGPLEDLEHWDEFLERRYPEQPASEESVGFVVDKDKAAFRDNRKEARPSVKEFYRLNHTNQTYDFVQQKRRQFLSLDKRRMSVWDA